MVPSAARKVIFEAFLKWWNQNGVLCVKCVRDRKNTRLRGERVLNKRLFVSCYSPGASRLFMAIHSHNSFSHHTVHTLSLLKTVWDTKQALLAKPPKRRPTIYLVMSEEKNYRLQGQNPIPTSSMTPKLRRRDKIPYIIHTCVHSTKTYPKSSKY